MKIFRNDKRVVRFLKKSLSIMGLMGITLSLCFAQSGFYSRLGVNGMSEITVDFPHGVDAGKSVTIES